MVEVEPGTPPSLSYVRRPEAPDDTPFLFRLFYDARAEHFTVIGEPLRERLLRQQFAAQSAGYRARYPNAAYDIVEAEGASIGRIVADTDDERLLLVDIALVSTWRGRGIGTALIGDLCAAARATNLPLRLSAHRANDAALRLYRRLGFAPLSVSPLEVVLEWRASGA
jgi:ribosomal protein S18 acetylase RimI-like enzyme